jgi:hypothetical protein
MHGIHHIMREIPRKRITSLNELSTDQLGNRLVVKGGCRGRHYSARPPPLSTEQAPGQIFEDDVNGFSSTSVICFMSQTYDVSPNLPSLYWLFLNIQRPGEEKRRSFWAEQTKQVTTVFVYSAIILYMMDLVIDFCSSSFVAL